jgi:hypothetical protein
MSGAHPVDGLAPEVRFALRSVARGLTPDEAAAVLRLDGAVLKKHLRTAVREISGTSPPPSAGDAALLSALEPCLALAREASTGVPRRCPGPDVAAALAAHRLDGPLLLAEIEHAADCRPCMDRLVRLLRARS